MLSGGDGDFFTLAFLVGFASPYIYKASLEAKPHVLQAERGDLASAEGAREADEEKGPVAKAPKPGGVAGRIALARGSGPSAREDLQYLFEVAGPERLGLIRAARPGLLLLRLVLGLRVVIVFPSATRPALRADDAGQDVLYERAFGGRNLLRKAPAVHLANGGEVLAERRVSVLRRHVGQVAGDRFGVRGQSAAIPRGAVLLEARPGVLVGAAGRGGERLFEEPGRGLEVVLEFLAGLLHVGVFGARGQVFAGGVGGRHAGAGGICINSVHFR